MEVLDLEEYLDQVFHNQLQIIVILLVTSEITRKILVQDLEEYLDQIFQTQLQIIAIQLEQLVIIIKVLLVQVVYLDNLVMIIM